MPILLTRQSEDSQLQPDPCDFSAPTEGVMVEQQVPIQELEARCDRYKNHLATLQPSQANIMVRASNFTVASVNQMLASSPGSSFIRVYYGIKENGQHAFFMAPVTETNSLDNNDPIVFVDDCCSCPPMGNCQDDELLNP